MYQQNHRHTVGIYKMSEPAYLVAKIIRNITIKYMIITIF